MRFVVARIEPRPLYLGGASIRRALSTLSAVEHVHLRRQASSWLVGVFVSDDCTTNLTAATSVETAVRYALESVLEGKEYRVDIASESLAEGGDGLYLLRTLVD